EAALRRRIVDVHFHRELWERSLVRRRHVGEWLVRRRPRHLLRRCRFRRRLLDRICRLGFVDRGGRRRRCDFFRQRTLRERHATGAIFGRRRRRLPCSLRIVVGFAVSAEIVHRRDALLDDGVVGRRRLGRHRRR